MKSLQKITALFLALLMLALPMISCGDDTNDAKNSGGANVADSGDTAGGDTPNIPDTLKFDGTEINFIVTNGDSMSADPNGLDLPQRSIYVDPEEADMGFEVNQKVMDRNTTVEERLGVKIVLKDHVSMQGLASHMQGTLSSGTYQYDVVAGYQFYDLGLAYGDQMGSFLDYKKIPEEEMYIDLSKPYWDEGLCEELAYNGAAYWITGDISQTWVGSVFVTFVNKDLWNSYAKGIEEIAGTTDIYKIVEDGKWTMDLLCELSRIAWIDKNSNDEVDFEDNVGFLAYAPPSLSNTMADGLVGGAHLSFTKWEDGVPSVDFRNNRNAEFADKLNKLYNQSRACLVDSSDNYIMTMWAEGRSLFTVNVLSQAEMYLSDMKNDYYVLPCPKLNEQQTSYSALNHDNVTIFGIPSASPNVAATTATLELMAYYSLKLVTPAYYDNALKERYSRDPKTAEMIDLVRNSIYHDFVMLWSNKLDSITHYFRKEINGRFASQTTSKQKGWQNKLDKLLEQMGSSAEFEN